VEEEPAQLPRRCFLRLVVCSSIFFYKRHARQVLQWPQQLVQLLVLRARQERVRVCREAVEDVAAHRHGHVVEHKGLRPQAEGLPRRRLQVLELLLELLVAVNEQLCPSE
jgi:hypothetical protein